MGKFRGSETSRIQATIYSLGTELGEQPIADRIDLVSSAEGGVLAAVRVFQAMGDACASFVLQLKANRVARDIVYGSLVDDDWVDVVVTRHGRPHHVLRGQIDTIRERTTVIDGATVEVIEIAGRDHGRILELTPIWFDIMSRDDIELTVGLMVRILDAGGINADPATTTRRSIVGFLKELNDAGKIKWQIPGAMPGVKPYQDFPFGYFADNVMFHDRDFFNYPNRLAPTNFSLFPDRNTSLAAFASRWADQPLCEFYPELMEKSQILTTDELYGRTQDGLHFGLDPGPYIHRSSADENSDLSPDRTAMAYVFRDRPFPTYSRGRLVGSSIQSEPIEEGPWFKSLTTHRLVPEDVDNIDVARSGLLRKNAFYVTPTLMHEIAGRFFDLQSPLWRPDDVLRHGFRRMDVVTSYVAGESFDIYDFVRGYRQRIRDFHCMNHMYKSGTISLARARPDIRIGTKLVIDRASEDASDQFYVESWEHSWTLNSGVRTRLGVSRGFTGGDKKLIDTMGKIVGLYHSISTEGLDVLPPEKNGPEATEVPDGSDDPRVLAQAYPPFSTKLTALLQQAIAHINANNPWPAFVNDRPGPSITYTIPESWADPETADGKCVHSILRGETGLYPGENVPGWIGYPNFQYEPRRKKYSNWAIIWSELRRGYIEPVDRYGSAGSSATGLGQLLSSRVALLCPNGLNSLGVPLDEAVGYLRYIYNFYTTPQRARQAKIDTPQHTY